MNDFEKLRRVMVENHLKRRGIRDAEVLRAMSEVPRERFLPPGMRAFAYDDAPLPIGEGQTISQPYIVALMTELLELNAADRVLEVGTGSGYAAAVLGRVVDTVYTIERHERLADAAVAVYGRLGYDNIHVIRGDGSLGYSRRSPYDAIVVTAAAAEVPPDLRGQLTVGGRLVIPVGSQRAQVLVRIRRVDEASFSHENHSDVRFVPLVGADAGEEAPVPWRAPA